MAYAAAKLLLNGGGIMGLSCATTSTTLLALPCLLALDVQVDSQTGNLTIRAGQGDLLR